MDDTNVLHALLEALKGLRSLLGIESTPRVSTHL
jgi:hypothetical protein